MSKYVKEISIGIIAALVPFLAFIGINVLPVLLILVVLFAVLMVSGAKSRIGLGIGRRPKSVQSSVPLTFDDIGGQERAKGELKEALEFLIKQDEISKLGIRPLKGILMTGLPGTGKTLMAKAAARYTDSVFVSASGSEFVEMYVGVGAGRVRDLFKQARQNAVKENKSSAIIFIDEIDAIGGKRDGGQHREYDQTLNQLLTEMDGMNTSESPRILLIAATNRKEMLDSALLRPGRFDRHIEVDLPDKNGRMQILNIHAKNKPLHEEVSLEKVAEESFGFSGAQLESVMNEAAIYALREEDERIRQRHLSNAIDKVMMGEKTDRQTTKEERERVAIHELGHAIMAETVHPESVAQVSLSPRGQALGYVRHHPREDRYLYPKTYLEDQIMIALGGSAAEEIFYGGRSTGSRNDFEQAIRMVNNMIESGLTGLGIVQLDMVSKAEYMKENNSILNDLFARTRSTLEDHRTVFEQSLAVLLDEEYLSGDRFRQLLASLKEVS